MSPRAAAASCCGRCRPVFRRLLDRADAERLKQAHDVVVLRLRKNTGEDEIEDEEADNADIGGEHGARRRRQCEEAPSHDEQRGSGNQEIRVEIVFEMEGAEFHRIDPGHHVPMKMPSGTLREAPGRDDERAREAAEQVIAFPDAA